jgi:hypothetical protein
LIATISPPIYGRRAFRGVDAARCRASVTTSARRQRGAHAQARARADAGERARHYFRFSSPFSPRLFSPRLFRFDAMPLCHLFSFYIVFILPPAISFFHAIFLTPLSLLLSAADAIAAADAAIAVSC